VVGRIEVLTGSMFSGKTEELLRRLKRLNYSKTTFLLFKPSLDIRYSETDVVTHEGLSLLARPVSGALEILEYWMTKPSNVVAIDEAQFFDRGEKTSLLEVTRQLSFRGVRVIIAGLDMNAEGAPFGLMPELMAIANEVIKLKACCAICGADASMSLHLRKQSSNIELGGSESYEARCLEHWLEGRAEQEKEKRIDDEYLKALQLFITDNDPKKE
jgi:thymidine kinase